MAPPPNDFPQQEIIEPFSLHARLEHVPAHIPIKQLEQWRQRHAESEDKVRHWPSKSTK